MHWPKVDQEVLLATGSYVQRLKMYPYFDLAHYILMISTVREDLGPGCAGFSRRHPLSCWLSSMVVCFAGSLLSNFLLGEPIVATFKRHEDIVLATAVWYCIFYSPLDIVYKTANILPIKIILAIMKEMQRVNKIHHGVAYASKIYPNSWVVHCLIGTAKGAGSVKVQLIRGIWLPNQSEILRPSFTTKACLIASVALTLDKNTKYISHLPHEIVGTPLIHVYLGVVLFFVYFKLSAILLQVTDPLAPFENLFCAVFMGGIWDAISRAMLTSKERGTNGKIENATPPQELKKDL